VEEAIKQIGFGSFSYSSSLLLLGPRQEERTGEDAAKFFYKVLASCPKKYQAIESIKVARAMLAFAQLEAARELYSRIGRAANFFDVICRHSTRIRSFCHY